MLEPIIGWACRSSFRQSWSFQSVSDGVIRERSTAGGITQKSHFWSRHSDFSICLLETQRCSLTKVDRRRIGLRPGGHAFTDGVRVFNISTRQGAKGQT